MLEPIPDAIEREAGYTLDRYSSPSQGHTATKVLILAARVTKVFFFFDSLKLDGSFVKLQKFEHSLQSKKRYYVW